MKAKEVREKSRQELEQLEDKLREELAAMRMKARVGQLAETAKIGATRRDIARILTLIKDKPMEAPAKPAETEEKTAAKSAGRKRS